MHRTIYVNKYIMKYPMLRKLFYLDGLTCHEDEYLVMATIKEWKER